MSIKVSVFFRCISCSDDKINIPTSIVPTHTWEKGTYKFDEKMNLHKNSGWEIKSPLSEEATPSEHIKHLIGILSRSEHMQNNMNYENCFVINVTAGKFVPELFFDTKLLRSVVDFGASIDIDVMISE